MQARAFFPLSTDLAWEERRLNILRIFLGALLLWRQLWIAVPATLIVAAGGTSPVSNNLHWLQCLLFVLFSLGLFTPIVGVILVGSYAWFSTIIMTYNLGAMIALNLLAGMLCLRVGSYWSLDRAIIDRGPKALRAILVPLYRIQGTRSLADFSLVRFVQLAIYASLSFCAVMEHLGDTYWRQGLTIVYTTVGTYFCSQADIFRTIWEHYPNLLWAFSILSVCMQTVFQTTMLPMLFFRLGFWFVVLQGLAFFVFSAVFLNLSILPSAQLLLWYFIFFNRSTGIAPAGVSPAAYFKTERPSNITRFYAVAYAILIFCAVSQLLVQKSFHVRSPALLGNTIYYSGLWHPNVFNKLDLQTSNRWPVIERRAAPEQQWELVPFTDRDGSRLWYHYSDLLYFSTIGWRRVLSNGVDAKQYNLPGAPGYEALRQIMLFDYSLNGFSGPIEYRVQIFGNCTVTAKPGPEGRRCYEPNEIFAYSLTLNHAAE